VERHQGLEGTAITPQGTSNQFCVRFGHPRDYPVITEEGRPFPFGRRLSD
jgi:hypothetical protein